MPAFSPDWAVFLDIDGTLLEHVERPDAVRADAARMRHRRRVMARTRAARREAGAA